MTQDVIVIIVYIVLGGWMSSLLMPGAWAGGVLFGLLAIVTSVAAMRRHPMNSNRRVLLFVLIGLSALLIIGSAI